MHAFKVSGSNWPIEFITIVFCDHTGRIDPDPTKISPEGIIEFQALSQDMNRKV
jgi:hypothetical protein